MSNPFRSPARRCLGAAVVLIASLDAAVAANPLVGTWQPAREQPNPEFAARAGELGELQITATHIAAFGEAPVEYGYVQDGQVFTVTAVGPRATPIDFLMPDPDRLLMRLPNDMEIHWERVAAAAPPPVSESGAGDAAPGDLISGVIALALPHAVPTRYEAMDQSLEDLLNDGWAITHAAGSGGGMGLVLERGGRHVLCVLVGDPQARSTGRSDCRRLN